MKGIYTLARRWIAVGALALAGAGFWGTVAAGLARYFFHLGEDFALLVVGLPIAIFLLVITWKPLDRALGFSGEDRL